MKPNIITALTIMFCCFVSVLSAATVATTPPQIHITEINGAPVNINIDLSDTSRNGFNSAYITSDQNTREMLAKYRGQIDLANGFTNASVCSSRAATRQGCQDYDIFALTTGIMLGVQSPGSDPSYINIIDYAIEKDGDIHAGIVTGVAFFNIGVNSKFLLPGLYLVKGSEQGTSAQCSFQTFLVYFNRLIYRFLN